MNKGKFIFFIVFTVSFIAVSIRFCAPAVAASTGHVSEDTCYADVESLARISGIVRYYSPDPYVSSWDSFDWFFIEYSCFKALEQGLPMEEVVRPYVEILAPNSTLTRYPDSGIRTLPYGSSPEQYSYWLHHGSGEVKIPSYARILYKELRNYRPFYRELVSCTAARQDRQTTAVSAAVLPRPDSVYSFRVGDSLWLNMPLAENTGAFSKKAAETLRKTAKRQWKQALRSYGSGRREQLSGIMGERAFRMADITARWNIVQHFYPYHEEDSLCWESRLQDMIVAVDTLKCGMLSREDIYNYREAIVKAMSLIRDAHLDVYPLMYPGYGIVSYFLKDTVTASVSTYDVNGAETEIRAKVIDSILIFNPSLTVKCYDEFLPYLDSIVAGKYRALVFDLREYPALDFDQVLSHLTDTALNTAPLFHIPLSCFPDRKNMNWDSHDDFIYPAEPCIGLPVYFLCGPETMSWGETVLMLAKGYGVGTVIGLPTAGTNGDASNHYLPAFTFRITAVKAVNLDGSRHHGIGVQPDIIAEIGSYEDAVRIIRDKISGRQQ